MLSWAPLLFHELVLGIHWLPNGSIVPIHICARETHASRLFVPAQDESLSVL